MFCNYDKKKNRWLSDYESIIKMIDQITGELDLGDRLHPEYKRSLKQELSMWEHMLLVCNEVQS